jgi:hypothetical protein
MSLLKGLDLPAGKIRFAGGVRGVDEAGHDAFELSLSGAPALYGEWRPIFSENGNNFNVEIVNFGYTSRDNLGNPHPDARRKFSAHDVSSIRGLIEALFASEEARARVAPFSSKKNPRGYLGRVIFRPGWIHGEAE